MKILLRALPYILVALAFYGGWYYWQQRPKEPLAAELLQIGMEDIKEVFVQPAVGQEFQFSRVDEGWLISSGHLHLSTPSPHPDELLEALVQIQSIDVAPAPEEGDQITAIEILLQDDELIALDLFEAPDSVNYHTIVRFDKQPDYFALADFNHRQLALTFEEYRSYELLTLQSWTSLDSLNWISPDTSLNYWSRPDSSLVLDSLKEVWGTLKGNTFADYFDEIGDEPDWYGSYRLYGGGDSIDLKVYFDSLWPQAFVLYSSQFPKHYFAVDSLPLRLSQ